MEADAIPTDVAELAAVWYWLPDAVRAGIVAMVRASGGRRRVERRAIGDCPRV